MNSSDFSLNTDKIKQKLNELNNKNSRSSNLWKPDEGDQKIRIVPYKYQKDFPFIELYFHYDLPGRNHLSPYSFGEPDPIVEFAEELQRAGGKDNYNLSRKLMPNKRTYAPVIVRGEEDKGVRFWGFGKTIFKKLLSYLADEDWGNFIDPANGNDLKLTYIPRDKSDTNFPKTEMMILPNSTPVTQDKNLLKRIFEDQVEITKVFQPAEYDELKGILEDYRDAGFDKESYQSRVSGIASSSSSSDSSGSSDDSDDSSDSSSNESQSATQNKSVDVDELDSELEDYFSN